MKKTVFMTILFFLLSAVCVFADEIDYSAYIGSWQCAENGAKLNITAVDEDSMSFTFTNGSFSAEIDEGLINGTKVSGEYYQDIKEDGSYSRFGSIILNLSTEGIRVNQNDYNGSTDAVSENMMFTNPAFVFKTKPSPVTVNIDGEPIIFDVEPRVISDRTMVPMRAIFERLGYSVDWDQATLTVTAKRADNEIIMQIDNKIMQVNNEPYETDVAPIVIDGRTLVPVRVISEKSGCTVIWNGKEKDVTILTAGDDE